MNRIYHLVMKNDYGYTCECMQDIFNKCHWKLESCNSESCNNTGLKILFTAFEKKWSTQNNIQFLEKHIVNVGLIWGLVGSHFIAFLGVTSFFVISLLLSRSNHLEHKDWGEEDIFLSHNLQWFLMFLSRNKGQTVMYLVLVWFYTV